MWKQSGLGAAFRKSGCKNTLNRNKIELTLMWESVGVAFCWTCYLFFQGRHCVQEEFAGRFSTHHSILVAPVVPHYFLSTWTEWAACAVCLANPRCSLVPAPCVCVVRLDTSWKGQVYSVCLWETVQVTLSAVSPVLGQGLCRCVSQLGTSFVCAFLLRKSKIKICQPIGRNICERDWMVYTQCVSWVPVLSNPGLSGSQDFSITKQNQAFS